MNASERDIINRAMPIVNDLADKRRKHSDLTPSERALVDEASGIATRTRLAEAGLARNPAAPRMNNGEERANKAFDDYLRYGIKSTELRAMGDGTPAITSAGSPTNGAQLVPPGWWSRLQVALKAFGGTAADFQQLDTPDSGQPMWWATVDPTTVVGSQISENTQISDVDYTFGQGALQAYAFTSGVHKVSLQLAQDSGFDIEGFINARVAEAIGRAVAASAISGTGSNAPLGIVTALNGKGAVGSGSGGYFGLAAATNVNVLPGTPGSTPGSATNLPSTISELALGMVGLPSLLAMVKSVDVAYRNQGAKWYLNDAQHTALRSMVDGFARPLMEIGVLGQNAETLLGFPIVVDNNVPALTASTTGGPIFGHLASTMVKRNGPAGVMALHERYADYLQVGYIGYQRLDIRSNDLRSAVTVKPAAT